jgi:hypothetical protein
LGGARLGGARRFRLCRALSMFWHALSLWG